MAQTQIFYIGTSKIKEIRTGGSVTFDWGNYGNWTTFKNPTAQSKKKVTYNKTSKNKAGSSALGGNGGVTVNGTVIPATATRTIAGVERTVQVRYYKRGYTKYTRTSALKSQKKMYKTTYTTTHPYQYRLQYKDKPITTASYSQYIDGMDYIYFADHYYNDGEEVTTTGHILHPIECDVTYSDVRRNFESSANNSDGRDNYGSYVLSNVRANVVSLNLKWTGLTEEQGADLLDTLNPSKDTTGKYNYVVVQYRDPATAQILNKTFYAGERKVTKYPSGTIKEISVTLTEV